MTSASDGVARVWNDKGEVKCIFKANNMLLASKWSKDNQFIASGGQDKQILIWKPLENGQSIPTISFKQDSDVTDIDWQTNSEFASSHSDFTIYLWSMAGISMNTTS